MKGFFCAVCACWMVLCAASVQAGELVVFDADSAPYMSLKDETAVGLYPAIVAEAFRRMGVEVRLEAAPWGRVLGCLEAGACAVGGLSKNVFRSTRFDYSEPIHIEKVLVYVAGKEFPFEGPESLEGKRVGVVRGYSYGDAFDKAAAGGRVLAVEDESEMHNFTLLAAGELDAVLSVKEKAELTLARLGLEEKVKPLPKPLLVDGVYLAYNVGAGRKALLDRFNAALNSMRQDHTLEDLISRSVQVR